MLSSKSSKGFGVRHILVYAGNPYDVMDRPNWFAESLFSQIATLCTKDEIEVTLTNAGGSPCSRALETPTPAGVTPTATPKPKVTPTAKPGVSPKASTSTSGGAGAATTNSASTGAAKGAPGGTPSTGVGSGWLTIGAALLLGGAGLVAVGERARRLNI
jgi:hypothetical protein